MDENCYNGLINAVNAINNPYSKQEERLAAETVCDEFKKRPDCAGYIFYILTTASPLHTDPIRHFALSTLRNTIIAQWDTTYTEQQKNEMKMFLIYYFKELIKPLDQEPLYIRGKYADIVCEVIKREWPQKWTNFHTEIIQLMRQDIQHFSMGATIFERLCSETADTGFDSRLTAKRRSELNKGINEIALDLVQLCLPFLPRKNRGNNGNIELNDSLQDIEIASCIIKLFRYLITCCSVNVFENTLISILAEMCPWCIYEQLNSDIIDFIYSTSLIKWAKERLSLYIGLYTSMLELFTYMNKVFSDIPSYYDIWKKYWRTLSLMLVNLPPPKVEEHYSLYMNLYTLYVSLCNYPSLFIVDIAYTYIPQLFADINYNHKLFPVYKECINNLFNNMYLCLYNSRDYYKGEELRVELNSIDFEDKMKYDSFYNNLKNRARIGAEGYTIIISIYIYRLSKYWLPNGDKHSYRCLTMIIEGILNGCTPEVIKSFSFVSNSGVTLLNQFVSLPVPLPSIPIESIPNPIYVTSIMKLIQASTNFLNKATELIPKLMELTLSYCLYQYNGSKLYILDDIEDMNRTCASTINKLTAQKGDLFVNYFSELGNKIGIITNNASVRASVKTSLIVALLNITQYLPNEQEKYSMINMALQPSFSYLSDAQFVNTISSPDSFMNLYINTYIYYIFIYCLLYNYINYINNNNNNKHNNKYNNKHNNNNNNIYSSSSTPCDALFALSSQITSLSGITTTVLKYLSADVFLTSLLPNLLTISRYILIDILYAISLSTPHNCKYSRGWSETETGGVKATNPIVLFPLSTLLMTNLLHICCQCTEFYKEENISMFTSLIRDYGSIFRYNHLRLWILDLIIPCCAYCPSERYISIPPLLTVTLDLIHNYLTHPPSSPYPLSDSPISADDLDTIFTYNRIKLLHVYTDFYLYICGQKSKGLSQKQYQGMTTQEAQQKRIEYSYPFLNYIYTSDSPLYSYFTKFTLMAITSTDEYVYMQILIIIQHICPLFINMPARISIFEDIFQVMSLQLFNKDKIIKGKEWSIITLLSNIYCWSVLRTSVVPLTVTINPQEPANNILSFLQSLPNMTSSIYTSFINNMKAISTNKPPRTVLKEFFDQILDLNQSSEGILGTVKPIRDIPEHLIVSNSKPLPSVDNYDLQDNFMDL
ncbi:hypothetical protein WA158_006752 [Blastocystis sp. Blastoise]